MHDVYFVRVWWGKSFTFTTHSSKRSALVTAENVAIYDDQISEVWFADFEAGTLTLCQRFEVENDEDT